MPDWEAESKAQTEAFEAEVRYELTHPSPGQRRGTLGSIQIWRILRLAFWFLPHRWNGIYDTPEAHQRYISKPIVTAGVFGTLGLLLLLGQVFVPKPLAIDRFVPANCIGLVRLAMILVGAFCIFRAWPDFVNIHDTAAEREQREIAKEDFDNEVRRLGR